MKKLFAVIAALSLFAVMAAIMFAMHDKFGDIGIALMIPVYIIVMMFFLTNKTINGWIDS